MLLLIGAKYGRRDLGTGNSESCNKRMLTFKPFSMSANEESYGINKKLLVETRNAKKLT